MSTTLTQKTKERNQQKKELDDPRDWKSTTFLVENAGSGRRLRRWKELPTNNLLKYLVHIKRTDCKVYVWTHNGEEIWGKGKLAVVEGILETVDQLIIGRCIMEEVKQFQKNLAIAFYDCIKAYDKLHHNWMLCVYEWKGIWKK